MRLPRRLFLWFAPLTASCMTPGTSARSSSIDYLQPVNVDFGRRLDSVANKTINVDPTVYTSSIAATSKKSNKPALSDELPSVLQSSSFVYDGTSSDFARQYLNLYAEGYAVSAMDFTHDDLPDTVKSRLEKRDLNFDNLDGFLQRAIVWDSGYAIGPDGELVEILVEGSRSMAEIAVSSPEYFGTGCLALACDLDGTDFYRHLYCNSTQINSVAHCGINTVSKKTTSSNWATGGDATDVPVMQVLLHEWTDGGFTHNVVSIHTVQDANDPVYGYCTINSYHSSLTIPCVPLNTSNANSDRVSTVDWSSPTSTDLVETWLNFASTSPGSSSGKSSSSDPASSNGKSPSDPSSSGKGDNGGSSSSGTMLAVVLAVGGLLVVAACIFICVVYRRRRRQQKVSEDNLQVEQPMPSPIIDPRSASPRVEYHHDDSDKGHRSSLATTVTTKSNDRSTIGSLVSTTDVGCLMLRLVQDPATRHLRIRYDDLEFRETISKGAFGEVQKCVHQREIFAAKRLISERQSRQDIQLFVDEILLTATLRHRNVIGVVGVAWKTPFDLCMVMEYFSGGDVLSYIQKHKSSISWAKEKLFIAYGLAEGLAFIHSRPTPVIHRDIKARNVLLNNMLEAKLIDFGVSRNCIDGTMTAGVGTPYWTAPEVLLGSRYTLQSDVYSFGVVLAELDCGDIPYRSSMKSQFGGDIIMMQVLTQILQNNLRPELSAECPLLVRELAMSCLDRDPNARPTAWQLPSILKGLHQDMRILG